MITEQDISDLLAKKYPPPAWAYLPQVRNETGYPRAEVRTADGLAMSLWPSRGIELYGFEIKVSRSDWHQELANPAKAEHFFAICDYWWVVAPKEIVLPEEVPATWGFMFLTGRGLKIAKQAPKLDPKPMDRIQIAAIMRNLEAVASPEARIKEAEHRGMAKERKESEDKMKYINDKLKELEKNVNEFGKYSGINLTNWHTEDRFREIGKAVNIVLSGKDMEVRERLQTLRDQMSDLVAGCDQALGENKK